MFVKGPVANAFGQLDYQDDSRLIQNVIVLPDFH